MPYNIIKKKCKQADGDAGSWELSYTDKKRKKHKACHTSRNKAQGQIAAIESTDEGSLHAEEGLMEAIINTLLEMSSGNNN